LLSEKKIISFRLPRKAIALTNCIKYNIGVLLIAVPLYFSGFS